MNDNLNYFRSAIFHCIDKPSGYSYEYYQDGLLIVDNQHIAKVGHYATLKELIPKHAKITHLKNKLIMPGFVDTHVHYPQYKVISSYSKSLLDWLNDYTFIEEQKFTDSNYASEIANLFFDELIKNGTTTAMSFCTSSKNSVEEFFTAAKKRNLRMIGGKVMMDRNAPQALCDNADDSYNDSKDLINSWHNNGRISYAITPRFAPTSTDNQLKKAQQLLNEYSNNENNGVLLQTHLNENIDEIKWVNELFPERKSYLDVYDHYNLTGAKSVFGHCIHNTEDELKQLADTNSNISLCPRSNLFLGSGLFNLEQLERYQIPCSLASDVGGGDSFSMFEVMNEAYKVCQLNNYSLKPSKAFYLATLAGAKALNIDNYIGNLSAKKEADFIIVDLAATTIIAQKTQNCANIEDLLFSLMTLGDDRLIDQVFILGKCIYRKPNNKES